MRWHDSEGFIDAELLEDMLPERDPDYYFCGPKPFIVSIIICYDGASHPRRFTSSSLGHARRWKARKPSPHDAQEWLGLTVSKPCVIMLRQEVGAW